MYVFLYGYLNYLFRKIWKVLMCLLTLTSFLLFNECTSGNKKKLNQHLSTQYILPPSYKNPQPKKLQKKTKNWLVLLFARSWRPGESVYMELRSIGAEKQKPDVWAFDKEIKLTPKVFGYSGLFGIPPWINPGEHSLTLKKDDEKREIQIEITEANFPSSISSITVKKLSNLTNPTPDSVINQIKFERDLKEQLYSNLTENKLTPILAHPRDTHRITSEFYKKRVYKKYKIENGKKIPLGGKTSIHKGLDLWGRHGMPIYAMARGKVILSKNMYYEGNTVILDHGNQIYSAYMHMSSRIAKVGQIIQPGKKIGKIGSTGAVTGPHLHVMVKINGELVDPLSFLALPIR